MQIWRDEQASYTAIEAYECIYAYRFELYIRKHSYSGTGNLIVRSQDFLHVGPFAGIQVAEDADWGRRAVAAGCTFKYVPNAIVYHPARRSLSELFVKWDRHLQHAVNISNRNLLWKLRWVGRAFAVLVSPIVEVPTIVFSDRINGVECRLKALSVLTAVRLYRFWKMLLLMKSNESIAWNRGDEAV